MKTPLRPLIAILALTALNPVLAITIGPSGTSATVTFDTAPATNEWATRSIGAGSGDYTTTGTLDDAVNSTDVSTISTNFPTTATVPPANRNALARHNSGGQYLQTFPTGNGATLVLATVTNGTGQAANTFTLTYDLTNPTTATGNEGNLPAHRVYFSLTGQPQSWQPVPAISGLPSPGTRSASFNVGSWPNGAPIYIVWADDNGDGDDPCWTLDNVIFEARAGTIPLSILLTSPAEGERFASCDTNVVIHATITGIPTTVIYYLDGAELAIRTGAPFSPVALAPDQVSAGPHTLSALAQDGTGATVNSLDVSIIVTSAPPVSIEITNIFSGTVTGLVHGVGSCLEAQYGFAGIVTNVELLLDLQTHAQVPIGLGHNQGSVRFNNLLAGSHSVTALAFDRCGNAYFSSTFSIEITNPPAPAVILIPNGSDWKYDATAVNIPTNNGLAFYEKNFDDTSWPVGIGEIGFGDTFNGTDPVNPETTLFNPPASGGRYTTYFRRKFTVADPNQYSHLVINVLRDDGAFVFLNGTLVFADTLVTPPLLHSNLCANATDDGCGYAAVTNGVPASLLVPGENVLAVALQQSANTSSDLSFDLMLWAIENRPRLNIALNPGSGRAEVTWTGAGYKLQFADTILATGTDWRDVPGNPQNFYEPPAGADKLFYRLTQ
jgi:hypothetical protein